MITQMEIDGFKTFRNFKVELAPFQVLVGPNGAGKSNFFDALFLLSRLLDPDATLRSAFQGLRGDAYEMFTRLSDKQSSNNIQIAVEMLVEPTVRDRWGGVATLKCNRLRYELNIARRENMESLPQLYIISESLRPIAAEKDKWTKVYLHSFSGRWVQRTGHQPTFIATKDGTITLSKDGKSGSRTKLFTAEKAEQTVLSGINNIEYPHAFAAYQELRSLRFLHLNPEILRQPGQLLAEETLSSDGRNLPTMLMRMQMNDHFALQDVSRDMANLVPDLISIEVEKDTDHNESTIWAKYQDGNSFSSRVLSDGTLRLLALATLKNDPQMGGLLCLEEPENGINPSYLAKVAHLLRALATDFSDPEQVDEPLRQVLVTTHSPTFITQPDAIDALLFVYTATHVEPERSPIRITQISPVVSTHQNDPANRNVDKGEASYTIDLVKKLLTNASIDSALESLNNSRLSLKKD